MWLYCWSRNTNSLDAVSDDRNYGSEHNLFTCACFRQKRSILWLTPHYLENVQPKDLVDLSCCLNKNFLLRRTQLVSLNNAQSFKVCLKAGVPQRAVLSPLLFNIYVNYLQSAISNCIIYIYEDNTLLLTRHSETQGVQINIIIFIIIPMPKHFRCSRNPPAN